MVCIIKPRSDWCTIPIIWKVADKELSEDIIKKIQECLKYNIPPFIIEDVSKDYYKRGLKEYATEKGFLVETCRASPDAYKKLLVYFKYI